MHCLISGSKRQAGFTLLELLIALVILVFIGVAAYQTLHVVTQSHRGFMQRSAEFRALIRAVNLLEMDLRQVLISPLSAESENGGLSFSTTGDKGEAVLDFVRQGWINSSGMPRSKILRVRWQLANGQLQRIYWDYFKTDDTQPHKQDVMAGIVGFKVAYLDPSGEWRDDWIQGKETKRQSLAKPPRALKVYLHHELYGDIQRILLMPETAEDAENNTAKVESPSSRVK